MISSLLEKWHRTFGRPSPEVIVRAPGRVNIIGEHTDYNEGWVLPGALSRSVYLLVSKNKTTQRWIADNIQEEYNGDIKTGEETNPVWVKLVYGTLEVYGLQNESFNILIGGDLPVGAGVSSSSSLVCGLLFAFQNIFGKKESKEKLALLGSRVEREIIGLQGGIMDQYAIMLSKAHHVMLLDCRTRTYDFIPAEMPGCKWILINTKVKHQLIDTDYNERAEECQRAVAIIQHQYPEVKSLRDVTAGMLASIHLPPALLRRTRFVLEENARVHEMVTAFKNKNAVKAGKLLKASHKGLKLDYEVSCKELDYLVDIAHKYEGVYGARMMGGGFGGCVLCLVNELHASEFLEHASEEYQATFEILPEVIEFELRDGVELINE